MSIKCVVCQNESEIKLLREQVLQLHLKLQQYNHEQIYVTVKQKQQLMETFKYAILPFHDESYDITGYQFITLTFDPKKYGFMQSEQDQKELMLTALMNYDYYMYGSFEYHKNGNIHLHAIIKCTEEQIKQMKKEIRHKFTDNPRNREFLDHGPAKDKSAIRYINKESKSYFRKAKS